MRFVILIAIVITALVWLGRAARAKRDIGEAAHTLSNFPRRIKFKKNAAKRGLDLINTPIEAATILMVCVAKLSDYAKTHDGLISGKASSCIINMLKTNMHITALEADELLTQMRWLVSALNQIDTPLLPMSAFLAGHISRSEADDLADMLAEISRANGEPNAAQRAFIDHLRDRLGLRV